MGRSKTGIQLDCLVVFRYCTLKVLAVNQSEPEIIMCHGNLGSKGKCCSKQPICSTGSLEVMP